PTNDGAVDVAARILRNIVRAIILLRAVADSNFVLCVEVVIDLDVVLLIICKEIGANDGLSRVAAFPSALPSILSDIQAVPAAEVIGARRQSQDLLHIAGCIRRHAEAVPGRSRRRQRDLPARTVRSREWNHIEVGIESTCSEYAEANQFSRVRRTIRIEARRY